MSPWLTRSLSAAPIIAFLARAFSRPLVEMEAILRDDSFYYIVIARHIVEGHGSTFDGITRTNGYHPLWLLVIVALVRIAGGVGASFFYAFMALLGLLALWTNELFARVLEKISPCDAERALVCTVVAYARLQQSFGGMEAALAMPLMALLSLKVMELSRTPSRQTIVGLGFLSASLVLTRIDSVIFVVLLLGVILSQVAGWLERWRAIILFGVGGIAVLAYFLWNRLHYGAWMTTSSEVKQLATGITLNVHLFDRVFGHGQLTPTLCFLLLPAAGFAALIVGGAKSVDPRVRAVLTALFAFPVAYYSILASRSSWPIFEWYLYPMPLVAAVSACLILRNVTLLRRFAERYALTAAVGSACVASVVIARRSPNWGQSMGIYQDALLLKTFSAAHEGVYAMGDHAGITAFVLDRPIVQLEGLVADQSMVRHIARRDNLLKTLREYGVNYLVESGELARDGGCAALSEPGTIAGKEAPRMTGVLCDPPVFAFHGRYWDINVFDLGSQPR